MESDKPILADYTKDYKNLSYNVCGSCDHWRNGKCSVFQEQTTADTPCPDDEYFFLNTPPALILR